MLSLGWVIVWSCTDCPVIFCTETKYSGLVRTASTVRNGVTGTWRDVSTASTRGSFSKPSSIVMNTTGSVVSMRVRTGMRSPAGP